MEAGRKVSFQDAKEALKILEAKHDKDKLGFIEIKSTTVMYSPINKRFKCNSLGYMATNAFRLSFKQKLENNKSTRRLSLDVV